MIRVAKGHKLRFTQNDIKIKGWALESRVYAEDPYKNFGLPSIGRLSSYVEPTHIKNVRCDSGIEEGSEISIYYDPMICKLVTYGDNRQQALDTMAKALDNYVIRGVTNNISLLRDIVTEDHFVKGDISTAYLKKIYPDGFKGKTLGTKEESSLVAIAAIVYAKNQLRSSQFVNATRLTSHKPESKYELKILQNNKTFDCVVEYDSKDGEFEIKINDSKFKIKDNFKLSDHVIRTKLNNEEVTMQLISKLANGEINLQYLGTKVSLSEVK